MRFMPAFLAVLSGVVFFFLLLEIRKNAHLAFLFSGFYPTFTYAPLPSHNSGTSPSTTSA
jgi:hypothetical protein